MFDSTLFCQNCYRYLGAAERCIFCDWSRPAAARIPAPNQPHWHLPTANPADGVPLMIGNHILLADSAGVLYAARFDDGQLLWRHDCGGALRAGIGARGARVYVATRAGEVIAIENDGRAAWHFSTRGGASGLTTDQRRIYLGDAEGFVYTLNDAETRAEIAWQVSVGQRVSAPPARWRHLLLVVTHHPRGQLVALDANSGAVAWSQPLGARGALAPVLVPQTAGGALVLATTDQGKVRALPLPSGEPEAWTFQAQADLHAAPIVVGDAIIVGASSGQVTALDASNGATRWTTNLDEDIVGLSTWEGLVFVGTRAGNVHALMAETGAPVWRWTLAGGLTAGMLAAQGRVFVGGGDGWRALPWHLGKWHWAAEWCASRGALAAAANFYALANEGAAAERAWLAAGQVEQAAWMWSALGQDRQAADVFRRAAEMEQASKPALAAAHLNLAADHFELADETDAARACRQRAGRMGNFPYLKLEAVNLPALEAGEASTIAVRVRNIGNGAARDVQFRLSGQLARCVVGALEQPLAPATEHILEFENLIPTAVGEQWLTVALTYSDGVQTRQAQARFAVQVAAPPPGAITIQDDTGSVIVRVPEGAPLPRVRIGGKAGLVRYEVVR